MNRDHLRGAVARFLATTGYYNCLLLAHRHVLTLEDAANDLLNTYHWPHLNVGAELSATLLNEAPGNRPGSGSRWLESRLTAMTPGPVLVTEIDLAFEPALELDPLALFKRASRVSRLVVCWPGTYQEDALTYAVPEHSHYRTWAHPEVTVVAL